MNARTERLRRRSLDARPTVSSERALAVTRFYRENDGRFSVPVMRALSYRHLCETKTIFIGEDELVVGERGPRPKAVPTYPELTCHSLEDLRILDSRPKTCVSGAAEVPRRLRVEKVIPYWRGRSHARSALRARCRPSGTPPTRPASSPSSWSSARRATRCSTTRSTGSGLRDFERDDRDRARGARSALGRPEACGQARGSSAPCGIACDAAILFAERHATLAERAGRARETDAGRRRRARQDRRGLPPGAGLRAARFPGGAPDLLVLPPGRDHRAERLGRVQPRPPRPASASLLRAGPGRGHAYARGARVSCSSASSSSSTTIPRRPRSGSPPPRAAPTPTSPTSTSAGCCATAATARTPCRTCCSRSIDELHLLQPSTQPAARARDPGRRPAVTRCGSCARATGFRRSSTPTPSSHEQLRHGQDASRTRAPAAARVASRPGPSARRPTSSPATSTCRRSSSWRSTTASTRAPANRVGVTTGAAAALHLLRRRARRVPRAAPSLRRAEGPRQPARRAHVRRG